MNGDNTARQVVDVATFEAGLFQHRFQCLLVRVHANGFSKITVAVRVFGQQATESWQDTEGLKIIGRFQRSSRL